MLYLNTTYLQKYLYSFMPCMKKEGHILNKDDDTIIIVGKNIAKYRKLKGISQRQLAILCNVENSSISKYENGKVWPNLKTLSNISRSLEVHIARFFDDPDK